MAWTDELKAHVIETYEAANPTPATSTEIIKQIAEDNEGLTANGVRMVLVQAGVYVKKDAASGGTAKPTTKAPGAEGTKRVSKDSQIAALRAAIEAKGGAVDDDVLEKMTGKAAAYFTQLLSS